MIYLDTAALVKLVRREVASDALVDWLNTHSDRLLVSSAIAEVELPRALRRTEPELLAAVPAVLARIADDGGRLSRRADPLPGRNSPGDG
jgi:predicted nucleic acid-binding protein